MYVHFNPIVMTGGARKGDSEHACSEWFDEENVALSDLLKKFGYSPTVFPKPLPFVKMDACMAHSSKHILITPNGRLAHCPEQFQETDCTGDIRFGETRADLAGSWKKLAVSSICINCVLFPSCVKPQNCLGNDRCELKSVRVECHRLGLERCYKNSKGKGV